jgi:hypothetical protein
VVERTLAWVNAHRRLARDDERDPEVSEALIRRAAINHMTRRLARRAQPYANHAGAGPTHSNDSHLKHAIKRACLRRQTPV